MNKETLKSKVTKEEVKKPFRFKLYQDNIEGLEEEGFDVFNYVKEYSSGDYEAKSIMDSLTGTPSEEELFLPLKVKVAWFKEKYPNGHWTFGKIFTPDSKASGSTFVTAYVWKDKADIAVISQEPLILNADAEGVGHVDVQVETTLELVYSRALNKALSSLGFDVPITELNYGNVNIEGITDTNEASDDKPKEEQLQIQVIVEDDTEGLVIPEVEVLQLEETAKTTKEVKEEPKEKPEPKVEKKESKPKRPATKRALEGKTDKKEQVKKVETQRESPKVKPQTKTDSELLFEKVSNEYNPTLEEALELVVKGRYNPKGKTLKELITSTSKHEKALVGFYANNYVNLASRNDESEESRIEKIKDSIAAKLVWEGYEE